MTIRSEKLESTVLNGCITLFLCILLVLLGLPPVPMFFIALIIIGLVVLTAGREMERGGPK